MSVSRQRTPKRAGEQALLPAGLSDILPPEAAFEAQVVGRLVKHFARHGYERVKPPLIEFEESLLTGSGAAAASQTFRLMDPVSQRMMGLRPDMTIQVARIAATRLANAPRPLRLSYAGQVLRVKGSQLRPERQFGQVGAELIGSAAPAADAEIIVMAAEALMAAGIEGLSVDLGLPAMVPALCAAAGIEGAARRLLRAALDRKDAAEVAAQGGPLASLFGTLLAAAGPAEPALAALDRLTLPEVAAAQYAALVEVVRRIRRRARKLRLTIDPVENRGYEYHTGVTFTFFALDVRGELGRGGRYRVGDTADGEPATGVTLFTDSLLRALPPPPAPRRLFLPAGTAAAEAARRREEGWITIEDVNETPDPRTEALRLGCSHVLVKDVPRAVGGKQRRKG